MANGDYISRDELAQYSTHFNEILCLIADFISENTIELVINNRGWPNIELKWLNKENLICCIQLFMNMNKKSYTLYFHVNNSDNGSRKHIKETIDENISVPFDNKKLYEQIIDAYKYCNSVKEVQLYKY